MKPSAGSPTAGRSGVGWGAALVFLLLGIFLLLQVSPVLNPVTYDESNLVYDGARLSQGEMPYRDFFNFVPPATFCLMAGAHPVLPDRPETAERYLVVALVFLTGLAWFLALKQLGWKRSESLASAALFLVCLYPFSPFAPHHWFALAFLVPAIALGRILSLRRESARAWFLPGLAAGLTLCTLQTAGFFACVFLAVLVLSSRDGRKAAVLRVLWSLLGCAAGLLLLIGPLFLAGAGRSLWRDLVAWPMANYHRPGNPNDVAFLSDLPGRLAHLWTFAGPGGPATGFVLAISGSLLYIGILVAALACLAAAFLTFVRIPRRRPPEPSVLAAATLTVLVFGVFVRSNPTWVHLVYGLPAVLFAWLCALASSNGRPLRRTWITAIMLVVLVSGLAYRLGLFSATPPTPRQLTDVDQRGPGQSPEPLAQGLVLPEARRQDRGDSHGWQRLSLHLPGGHRLHVLLPAAGPLQRHGGPQDRGATDRTVQTKGHPHPQGELPGFPGTGRSSVAPPEVALPEGGGNAGSHYPGKKGERRRPRGLTGRRACRAGAARPFGWDPQ